MPICAFICQSPLSQNLAAEGKFVERRSAPAKAFLRPGFFQASAIWGGGG